MGDDSGSSYNTAHHSSSFERDDDILDVDFLQRFDSEDIRDLRQYFFDGDADDKRDHSRPKHRSAMYGGNPLNKNQFITAIDKVVGSTTCSLSASRLFQMLDSRKQGWVWWEEVLDHILQKTALQLEDSSWTPLDARVVMPSTPHCKRETIIKVIPIETSITFCYAVVSKFGRVGVYDGNFDLQDSYLLQLRYEDPGLSVAGEYKRRISKTWVTDGVYLPDADALVYVSSDRALHLYDCAGLIHAPLCHVAGLGEVPLCLAYCPGETSMLFIGDDKGGIASITFLQPRLSLFRKKHPDKLDKYYWMELDDQSDWVRIRMEPGVHGEAVRQVAFFPDNRTLVSCSQDPHTTLVIRHLSAKRVPYIFKLARGVRCFHLDRTMRLLATGSSDSVVRLWNPVVTKQPTVSLFGHKTAVVDVLILRHMACVLSFSRDGVMKVWDINDYCCNQTLHLNFPSFSVLGKRIDFGNRSIYPGPSSGKPPQSEASGPGSESDPVQPESTSQTQSSATVEDLRDNPSEPSLGVWRWEKLVVACCNHIGLLRLRTREEEGGSRVSTPSPLPPPSREQHASAPSPWQLTETTTSARSTPLHSARYGPSEADEDEFESPLPSRRSSTSLKTPIQGHTPLSMSRRGSEIQVPTGYPIFPPSPRLRRASDFGTTLRTPSQGAPSHSLPRRGSDTAVTLKYTSSQQLPRSRSGSDLQTTLEFPASPRSFVSRRRASDILVTVKSPDSPHPPQAISDFATSLRTPTSRRRSSSRDIGLVLTPPSERSHRASLMSEALPDREFKQKKPVRPLKGLHARRVFHSRLMKEAQNYVEQCAPHLALQLWDLDEVAFSQPLPVTARMRERGVDVSDPERLMRARFKGSTSLSVTASGSQTSGSRGSPSDRSARSLSLTNRKVYSPDCFKLDVKPK